MQPANFIDVYKEKESKTEHPINKFRKLADKSIHVPGII